MAALWEMWWHRRIHFFFLLKKHSTFVSLQQHKYYAHNFYDNQFFLWKHFFIIKSSYIVELSPWHPNHQRITVTSDEWKWHINETNEMHRNTHPINLRSGKPMRTLWLKRKWSVQIYYTCFYSFFFWSNWYEFNQLFSDSRDRKNVFALKSLRMISFRQILTFGIYHNIKKWDSFLSNRLPSFNSFSSAHTGEAYTSDISANSKQLKDKFVARQLNRNQYIYWFFFCAFYFDRIYLYWISKKERNFFFLLQFHMKSTLCTFFFLQRFSLTWVSYINRFSMTGTYM